MQRRHFLDQAFAYQTVQPPEEQRLVPGPGEHLPELGQAPAGGSAAWPQLELGQEVAIQLGLGQKVVQQVVQQEWPGIGHQMAFVPGSHQELATGIEDSFERLLNLVVVVVVVAAAVAAAQANSLTAGASHQRH